MQNALQKFSIILTLVITSFLPGHLSSAAGGGGFPMAHCDQMYIGCETTPGIKLWCTWAIGYGNDACFAGGCGDYVIIVCGIRM
jgi:hypothetical protein